MNLKELKEVIAIFEESGLSELELEREGVRLRLRRGEVAVEGLREKGPREAEAPSARPEGKAPAQAELWEVTSPMVGTFYSAAAPDTEPFVEVGTRIEPGEVVCIIEAMKLMNEVKSDVGGIVREVAVENGQAVEFGEVLFRLETRE